MSKASYRSAKPTRCTACETTFDDVDDVLLSGRGPVCAACHRRDAQVVRERDQRRAISSEALINGVFALGAAAMLWVTAFFTPTELFAGRILVICGLLTIVLVGASVRAWRFARTAPHVMIGRVMVAVGAIVGAISAAAILGRLGG